MLKILSWNIQQGGGTRVQKILRYIQQSESHILILSEFRNNAKGAKIRSSLLSMGYRYQQISTAPKETNSVIIASQIPFNGRFFTDIDPEYSANVVLAEFDLFRLYGGYLPHKKKHVLFPFLLNETQKGKASIITGDLNSGINGIDQAGTSFWYEDEMKALHKQGMKDAFRVKNGSLPEYSWYSHAGNGYRYDHYLVQDALLPIVDQCVYDHTARVDKLSDHSPMFLIFRGAN